MFQPKIQSLRNNESQFPTGTSLIKLRMMGLKLVTRAPPLIGQRNRKAEVYNRRVAADPRTCGKQVLSHRDVGPTWPK